jgi:hypothetical protein
MRSTDRNREPALRDVGAGYCLGCSPQQMTWFEWLPVSVVLAPRCIPFFTTTILDHRMRVIR